MSAFPVPHLLHTNERETLLEAGTPQRLGDKIRSHITYGDMFPPNDSLSDSLPDVVMLYVDILRPSMMYRVLSQYQCASVICFKDCRRTRSDSILQFTEQLMNPVDLLRNIR